MRFRINYFIIICLLLFSSSLFAQPELKLAKLGNFKLESGKRIKDCVIGYRTYGELNEEKSNVILFPTWLAGKSEHLDNLIGRDLFVDDKKYFIIAVDALGNGNSSSPSNNEEQPGKAFPKFTIRDIVDSQHRLLTKKLKIKHLYGMIGGSMGGMQVFEWIVSYPDFMDKAVAYVSSPKLTSYDLLLWYTTLLIIEEYQVYDLPEQSIGQMIASIQSLFSTTPEQQIRDVHLDDFQDFITTNYEEFSKNFIPDDWASQVRAMMEHDVTLPYYGFIEGAAEQVQADVLIIVNRQDHLVNPQPALDFAKLIQAKTIALDDDHGHLAIGKEKAKIAKIIRNFWDGHETTPQ